MYTVCWRIFVVNSTESVLRLDFVFGFFLFLSLLLVFLSTGKLANTIKQKGIVFLCLSHQNET